MRGTIALASLASLLGLSGCITSTAETPEWFTQRSAESDASYPSLRDVPRTASANVDPGYWAAIETDLVAAGAEVLANPRSQPASATEDPATFLEEAREELEEARQSHEP